MSIPSACQPLQAQRIFAKMSRLVANAEMRQPDACLIISLEAGLENRNHQLAMPWLQPYLVNIRQALCPEEDPQQYTHQVRCAHTLPIWTFQTIQALLRFSFHMRRHRIPDQVRNRIQKSPAPANSEGFVAQGSRTAPAAHLGQLNLPKLKPYAPLS